MTVTAAVNLPSLTGDPAGAGRRAALEAIADAYASPEGTYGFAAAVQRVETGPAPQAFKDAFADTVNGLLAALRG